MSFETHMHPEEVPLYILHREIILLKRKKTFLKRILKSIQEEAELVDEDLFILKEKENEEKHRLKQLAVDNQLYRKYKQEKIYTENTKLQSS